MNNGIVSLSSIAGHPAFFDPMKKLLVEALPNSTFRIAKVEKNRSVAMTVSAAACKAHIEARDSAAGVTSSGTFSTFDLEHRPGRDVFEEGKQLLEECGCSLKESKEDKDRLNEMLRRALNADRVNPGEIHPGDCAGILWDDEDEGHNFLTSFYVIGGATPESLQSSQDVKFVYKHVTEPADEGISRTSGSWSFTPVESFPMKPVLMDPSDHDWLEKLADFTGGEASLEKGKSLLIQAIRMEMRKEWHGEKFRNRPEVTLEALRGKNLLGGVAI